jgi:FKBP-type peptidyl-prolyl cis-trans isomerase
MATQTRQRIGIWIIAVVLTVGTLAGFVAMIMAPENQAADQARLQQVQTEYQAKVTKQQDELSNKYYVTLVKYKSIPAAFAAKSVKKVVTKDLKDGTGTTIKKDTAYSAYYIGWTPNGKVFEQSIDGKKLSAPAPGGNMIEGWNEGVVGMKIGGVRLITIPSEKAYGKAGSGENIPPNTPLKFIVMAIPTPKTIPVPQELINAYDQQQQQ